MHEQSKAAKRRFSDGAFHTRFYVGDGIDIGCGSDPLSRYVGVFAKMTSCRGWDLADGDAEKLEGVADDTYDFVNSSHCLEHLHSPHDALWSWLRVVKPGGFVIVTVPDATLYEGDVFPSRWNHDHKWMFSIETGPTGGRREPRINLLKLLNDDTCDYCDVERLWLVRDFWQPHLAGTDQTLNPNTESCIEFILRKHGAGATVPPAPPPSPDTPAGTPACTPLIPANRTASTASRGRRP